ncbi:RAxF-45 family protein [Paenisporosarcina sp. HGH0030]|uniref:RAxF-45 family protein n=1 Tax=Paenisporosarcina sp. HGH0030 TaxID=1078085 RepID=UPI00350FDF41
MNGGEERMKNAVNARGFILEFLSTSCAITHEISNNGTGLSNFRKLHAHHS